MWSGYPPSQAPCSAFGEGSRDSSPLSFYFHTGVLHLEPCGASPSVTVPLPSSFSIPCAAWSVLPHASPCCVGPCHHVVMLAERVDE